MKKVGIIGGIGPASTLDYYSGIIEGYRMRTNTEEYPLIVIDSVNMTKMLQLILENHLEELVDYLVNAINHLAAAGAEYAAIASNTPHIVFEEVNKKSVLPLISIIDETCKYAQMRNFKKVVVLGTKITMSSGIYNNALKKYGIDAVVPSKKEQEAIQSIIFPNLENGIILPEDKEKMLRIAISLVQAHKADGLILGCTELPLMIKQDDIGTPIINSTQIHIESIIKELLLSSN